MHRIKFSETEIIEVEDYRDYFSRPCDKGDGVAEIEGLPWKIIVAYKSGAVAEAWESGAVAEAWESGAVAEAWESGAVAEAWESGAVAQAWESGAVAVAYKSGAVAEAWESGAVAQACVSGAVAQAWESGAVAEAYKSGAVAEACVSGAVAQAWESGAVIINPDGSWTGDISDKIPAVPDLYGKILDAVKSPGNDLCMRDWHKCETSHCIAGWTTTLAGEAGKALEDSYGSTHAAAVLIHMRSCPGIPIPDYFCDDEKGMEQIEALAGRAGKGG